MLRIIALDLQHDCAKNSCAYGQRRVRSDYQILGLLAFFLKRKNTDCIMRKNREILKQVIQKFKFSGHQTFVARNGWLEKGVDLISKNPHGFLKDDAVIQHGTIV